MTNVEKLKTSIKDSGIPISEIARRSGILRETLYNRFDTGDFKISEVEALSSALKLTKKQRDDIFFTE